ncbi:hypothetical protein [Acaryochloris sp. IP29b_bin.148]|uniref:hypothetical protein n=1 Tax=Acaryochloris sp. IP29b_bin.148 TaxID=2969218 RepID=UPI002633AC0F|nr:hypothetical protein [Acaryochloris sp. IP29b_bin.148]
MANLQNRIDIAAANHDHHLLELLANERTQLESYWRNTPSSASRQRRVTQLWQYITKEIASRSQLSVERRVTANGEEWWHVADPRSGKTFNAESFSVAMHWIERNRLGH